MVSRVYTPLVQPYPYAKAALGNHSPVSSAQEQQQAQQQTEQQALPSNFGGDASDLQRPSSGLQAIQYSANQKIPLDAVINDFKSTMNALGADDKTRSEVNTYLNVVRLQAGKDQPEVPYIKQTLRTAANSLDQFIGKALGQPSKVVKEWVDAMLLQNIDYKADLSQDEPDAKPKTAGTNADASSTEAEPVQIAQTDAASASTKTQVKSLIESAKASQQAGNSAAEADQHLQSALDLLKDSNRPDWEGKVWRMRGRIFDRSGQWEQATDAYQQAASSFETANLPQKQAQSLQAMASIQEEHGRLDQAKSAYQQVVALDLQSGSPDNQVRSLNDLASVMLRQGDGAQAAQTLQQATQVMQANAMPPDVQSDIFSNLGAAHQQTQSYDKAIQAYQQSLQTAKDARDRGRYSSALQQLATLYVQNSQPDEAMTALRRLKALETA